MPLYSLRCKSCGRPNGDIFRSVEERDLNLPSCEGCSGQTYRQITPTFIRTDIESYVSPTSGKLISSRAQRKEDLLQTNHFEWEPGVDKDISRRRQEKIEESLLPIDHAVDQIVTAMSTSGKLDNLNG